MKSLLAKLKRLVVPAPVAEAPVPVHSVAQATVEHKSMANILTSIEHGFEVAAEDVLKAIPFIQKAASTAVKAEPQVVAALGVLLGQTATALSAVSGAAAQPVNIVLDVTALNAIKPIWSDVVEFASTIGIKL